VLHEGPLSCQSCAACCRHAYDLVPLGKREPARRLHPELVETDGNLVHLRRDPAGQRCAALSGPAQGPYACSIYADRPRTCRDFPLGGTTCLEARRRVGLTI
jgi:Fe-S-cluster containining protein